MVRQVEKRAAAAAAVPAESGAPAEGGEVAGEVAAGAIVAVAARPGGETAARDGAALGGGSPSAVGREGAAPIDIADQSGQDHHHAEETELLALTT